ncbi:5-methyltetrahydrofolate--homocysteine methyltransferase [Plasticicumulans lactativorans]|uniref:5-methyltetrahydrofolate--homocysteine methyltransferase n=1 Tax=Plasticicumulans lactativorans TaxID=1133106 RepID=A0A4R2LAX6_9GAMM|nr:betaine--homocysteine S-methyltransferase [Plasticicumulans lactativorans]TCO81499.1 5-methyltetrahydrofolate--homocysteine methyltransferase [Plasticicumulans lactativorans]
MNRLLERLAHGRPLLADGATGTNLYRAGLRVGDAPEPWNLTQPARIAALHAAFVAAGADVILTNSFGANRFRLGRHGAARQVAALNAAAARLARGAAAGAERGVVVAGSIGPTGEVLAPHGPLAFDAAVAAFAEQARALADGGVDALWLETLSAPAELDAALAGAAVAGLPLVVTLTFDADARTPAGLDPAGLVARARSAPVVPCALGSNCGAGPAATVASVVELAAAAGPGTPLVAKGNAGLPRRVGDDFVYDASPALMAEYARLALDAGARLVGGCCGTTPAHLRAMRAALDGWHRGPPPQRDAIATRLAAAAGR